MLFSLLAAAALAGESAKPAKSSACAEPREFTSVVAEIMLNGEEILRDELFDEIVNGVWLSVE